MTVQLATHPHVQLDLLHLHLQINELDKALWHILNPYPIHFQGWSSMLLNRSDLAPTSSDSKQFQYGTTL